MKPVEGSYFNEADEPTGSLIYELYNSFRYLTESNKLNEVDLAQYKEMADDENFICDTANKNKKYADPYIKRNDVKSVLRMESASAKKMFCGLQTN